MTQLFLNASQVVTCAGPARARRGEEQGDAAVRERVGIATDDDGRILTVAPESELRAAYPSATIVDCGHGVLTPGFVDSHTHAIFGRARYEEQEMRAAGLGYLEISKRGGGIHSSVRDLRLAALAELTGDDFDRRWAELMIAHHEGAIEMAREVLADGADARVRALAEAIVAVQEREIAALRGIA